MFGLSLVADLIRANWGKVAVGVALAAGLAFSHYKAYTAGESHIEAQWAQARANDAIAAQKQTEERVLQNAKVDKNHQLAKARYASDSARLQRDLGRLRDALAVRSTDATGDAASPGGADAARAADLPAAALVEAGTLAQEADRLAAKVGGLQAYVLGVCLGLGAAPK